MIGDVVGIGKAFFEDEVQRQWLGDMYSKKASIWNEEQEGEADLTSEALRI